MAGAQYHFAESERLLAESRKRNADDTGAATLATQASVHVQLAALIMAAEVARGNTVVLDTRGIWAGEQHVR